MGTAEIYFFITKQFNQEITIPMVIIKLYPLPITQFNSLLWFHLHYIKEKSKNSQASAI